MPALAMVPAADNSPPTPWRAYLKPSVLLCLYETVVELIDRGLRRRDICTRKAFENAAVVVAGNSWVDQCRLASPGERVRRRLYLARYRRELPARTPYLADLKPGGRFVAKDMGEAGGVPMLLRTLLDGGHLHGDVMTITGKTLEQNLAAVTWRDDQSVIRPFSNPLSATSGVVGLSRLHGQAAQVSWSVTASTE